MGKMQETMPPEFKREAEVIEPRSTLEITLDRLKDLWPRVRIDWVRWWVALSVVYVVGLFLELL